MGFFIFLIGGSIFWFAVAGFWGGLAFIGISLFLGMIVGAAAEQNQRNVSGQAGSAAGGGAAGGFVATTTESEPTDSSDMEFTF